MNKKGWLRIIEASISIVLILGTMLTLIINKESSSNEALYKSIPPLLDELSKNITFRASLAALDLKKTDDVNSLESDIDKFTSLRLAVPGLAHKSEICSLKETCSLSASAQNGLESEIYSTERIIIGTPYTYAPKKIKLFLWLEK